MVHPRPKQGSGKNGNVIKRDWCARLVEVVCKGISAEEKKSIVDSMCSPPKEDVDVELLCAMSQLSPEENFAALSKVAMQTLDQKVYGSCEKATAEQAKKVTLEEAQAPLNAKLPKLQEGHRAATSENHVRNFNLTPQGLKLLLPGKGTIKSLFWARYHPGEKWFRVTYPSSILEIVEQQFLFFELPVD